MSRGACRHTTSRPEVRHRPRGGRSAVHFVQLSSPNSSAFAAGDLAAPRRRARASWFAGTLLGLLVGILRAVEEVVDSIMQMLRMVPFVGLIPLFVVWFGIGDAAKYAVIAVGTAFPMYLNIYAGVRNADGELIDYAEAVGMSRLALIRHVLLPSALPNAFVGLRLSLGFAWIALIFAETINASTGIGYLMNNAEEFDATNIIIVCLAVYAILGLLIDLIVRALEWRLLAWRPTFAGR